MHIRKKKKQFLILPNINTSTDSFTSDEIISILELLTNCPILINLCNLYKEQNYAVDYDYNYEIEQKDHEIGKLKSEIDQLNKFPPIIIKPKQFEQNIFKACKNGDFTSFQWLIEKENIDKNIKVTDEIANPPPFVQFQKKTYPQEFNLGDSLIHIAVRRKHLLIVQYLIEVQNIDPNVPGNHGKTPLHYACLYPNKEIAEYLISKGANIEAKDDDGNQIIHSASIGGLLPIVQYLIETAKIDKDITNSSGKTPLHYACLYGHERIVEYLISQGANIEAKDVNSWTPLHFTAIKLASSSNWHQSSDKEAITKYLISKGANKNATNKDGKTPYDIAFNSRIKDILME